MKRLVRSVGWIGPIERAGLVRLRVLVCWVAVVLKQLYYRDIEQNMAHTTLAHHRYLY